MNAQNVAMVFVPNITQMADPLTALIYVVQVMNFLKTLIVKTLRDREESVEETGPAPQLEPSDEDGRSCSSKPVTEVNETNKQEKVFLYNETLKLTGFSLFFFAKSHGGFLTSIEKILPAGKNHRRIFKTSSCEEVDTNRSAGGAQLNMFKTRYSQSSNSSVKKWSGKGNERTMVGVTGEKGKGSTIVSRLHSRTELVAAWQ